MGSWLFWLRFLFVCFLKKKSNRKKNKTSSWRSGPSVGQKTLVKAERHIDRQCEQKASQKWNGRNTPPEQETYVESQGRERRKRKMKWEKMMGKKKKKHLVSIMTEHSVTTAVKYTAVFFSIAFLICMLKFFRGRFSFVIRVFERSTSLCYWRRGKFHAVLKGKKFLKDYQYLLNYFLCWSTHTNALLVCNILHHYCNVVFLYA